jgi:hypothetical protein
MDLCIDVAWLSFECPEDFVEVRISIEAKTDAKPSGMRTDPDAQQRLRTERLRQLRARRGEPLDRLRARCAAGVAESAALPSTARAVFAECDQKAACSLKVACLRPLLEARAVQPIL